MSAPRRLFADTGGAAAAEFALVAPLLVLLIFGVIDAGRYMWQWNQLEKATQMGARMAVVTDVLAPGIASKDFVGVTLNGVKLTQGDRLPASAMAEVVCNANGCTSTDASLLGTAPTGAFARIVHRMKMIRSDIGDANVRVIYRGSNLGFAGNPSGPDLSPLVTVELTGVPFRPITAFLFLTLTLPDRGTTLSAEDLTGSQSN